MKTILSTPPFLAHNQHKPWRERGLWPCAWVRAAGLPGTPVVAAYRRRFTMPEAQTVTIHVAADERYDLYLDGEWIGSGNERGAPDCWFFDSYELSLAAGDHTLVARVWSLGEQAAEAQMQVGHGFLLAAEGALLEELSTGVAEWQSKILEGYSFVPAETAHWRGARISLNGHRYSWDFASGEGDGWQAVVPSEPAMGRFIDWQFHHRHLLRPATLPSLLRQPVRGGRVRFAGRVPSLVTRPLALIDSPGGGVVLDWQRLLTGAGTVTVPARQTWRVLIDLEQYQIGYSRITVSGGAGALLRLNWAESLYQTAQPWNSPKGNRDVVNGKYFIGYGDTFITDGGSGRCFEPLWWMAGRYLELCVQTAEQPVVIEQLELLETRYPLEMEGSFHASDPRLEAVLPLLVRGLQMCANETYFDCPYYEELQYAGDTRLECLVTYSMTRDDRLPRKALRLFDLSRRASGLTQSRYPSRVMQIIPPFALWWVMMVRDYACWRADLAFTRGLLPGVRATLEGFERWMGADGVMYGPEGWNTIDWVPAWDADAGVPPDGHSGASGILNGQLLYTLLLAADLEQQIGQPLLAELYRQRARTLFEAILRVFWSEERGLLADDRQHAYFSEHAQCFLLLADELVAGLLPSELRQRVVDGLLSAPDLARTTIYFSHYLFETYRCLNRVDLLLERMELWFDLRKQGLKTTIEMPEPSRSDCHGWGAHPLFHYYATILGIRPAQPGFAAVEITPRLGPLQEASGRLPHPEGGWIEVSFQQEDGELHGSVRVPAGVACAVHANGKVLSVGANGSLEF